VVKIRKRDNTMGTEEQLQYLEGKVIILGITGSIAAYKAADVVSQLVKWGAEIHVIMTEAATRFIAPLTLQTLSRNPVHTSMWQDVSHWEPGHISLADRADLMLVAPLTAQTMANFANGQAPDLLSSTYLATLAPVMLAPAMNGKMYDHPATRRNLDILLQRGHMLIEPETGMLACGYEGKGKLAQVGTICERVRCFFAEN
jgi:phosphopantothenoylcysteine decarboxylase/phosphopantothenate--cysteine ligase